MMKTRGGMKRKLGINHMGAAVKGRPVVARGAAGRMKKGRKSRGMR